MLNSDTIPMMTNHRSHSRRRLQDQLIKAKCLTSIVTCLNMIISTQNNKVPIVSFLSSCFLIVGLSCVLQYVFSQESNMFEKLCCSFLRAVTAILRDNKNSKEVFASVVGYKQLGEIVQALCPINQTILKEFLSMVCE